MRRVSMLQFLEAQGCLRARHAEPEYAVAPGTAPLLFLLVGLVVFTGAPSANAAVAARQSGDSNWNREAAAAYLDARTASWAHGTGAIDHGTFCVSCHTALPYAEARSALRAGLDEKAPSATERLLLDSVTKRVRLWKVVRPFLSGPSESRGTESVLNALVLATYGGPQISDDTRLALNTMWATQLKDGANAGAWPWFSLGNEPWEAPDSQYWGATLAAITVGELPVEYQAERDVQSSLRLLKDYLRQGAKRQSILNRISLLRASTGLSGLLNPDEKAVIIRQILNLEQPDGGWSASELSLATWKRHDGTAQETKSDGYATGLVTFVLEETDPVHTESAIKAGRSWLLRNQDPTGGFWPAYSLNMRRDPKTDVGRFMTDAATAYAVLALSAAPAPFRPGGALDVPRR